jgi:hypothetical protein
MSSWQASDSALALKRAEAQMRRADSFWASFRSSRDRARRLLLAEISRRFLFREEFNRPNGPSAIALRVLERRADWAHDRRLFEIDNAKTLARRARDAEMQARIFYEESEGR